MLSFIKKIFKRKPATITTVYVGWYGDSSRCLTVTFSSPAEGFPLMFSFTCKNEAVMRQGFKEAMKKKSFAHVTRFITAQDSCETFDSIQEACHKSMRLRGFK